jgi:hypothetical protein
MKTIVLALFVLVPTLFLPRRPLQLEIVGVK